MPKKNASQSKAFDLLVEDHKKVKKLFKQFEKTEDDNEKREIVDTTLAELMIHAQVEEEIVYPVLRKVIEEELMDEADIEHYVAKVLMRELSKMKPSDEYYDAKFTVLGEIIEHHIEEEEGETFPKGKKVDSEELAQQVLARKRELMEQLEKAA